MAIDVRRRSASSGDIWISAAAHAAHVLPFEVFLLAMLLEEHKEVMRLRTQVEELERRRI